MTRVRIFTLRQKYDMHKRGAGYRGISFELTYEQWLAIWKRSRKLDKRGRKAGQYVMARLGDRGPYSIDNVKIVLATQNSAAASLGRKHPPRSAAARKAISDAMYGRSNPMPQTVRDKIARSVRRHYAKRLQS